MEEKPGDKSNQISMRAIDSDEIKADEFPAIDFDANEETRRQWLILQMSVAQLCINHGGSVSIPMLPKPANLLFADLALEGKIENGCYVFRLRKR